MEASGAERKASQILVASRKSQQRRVRPLAGIETNAEWKSVRADRGRRGDGRKLKRIGEIREIDPFGYSILQDPLQLQRSWES